MYKLHLPPSSCATSSPTYSCFHPPFPCSFTTTPGLPQAGSRAGPGPRRGGLIGDHAGGTLRGRPPQRPARALPRPGPHAPNLRRATERCGWVGKQPAGGDRRFCFVLNQLFNIPIHAARRAMAAAACRYPSLSLTRKTTAFFLRYTPFLPSDQLARS